MDGVARECSDELNREITYSDIPSETWERELKKAGLPDHLTKHLVTVAELKRRVGMTGWRTASQNSLTYLFMGFFWKWKLHSMPYLSVKVPKTPPQNISSGFMKTSPPLAIFSKIVLSSSSLSNSTMIVTLSPTMALSCIISEPRICMSPFLKTACMIRSPEPGGICLAMGDSPTVMRLISPPPKQSL